MIIKSLFPIIALFLSLIPPPSPIIPITPASSPLHSKLIVITGTTSGIGQSLAHKLAHQHNAIIITGSTSHSFPSSKKLSPGSIIQHPLDLTSPSSVRLFATFIMSFHTPIHALINNAGVLHCRSGSLNATQWGSNVDPMLASNTIGPFALSSHLESSFDQDSILINVASVVQFFGNLNRIWEINDVASHHWSGWDTLMRYADSKRASVVLSHALSFESQNHKIISFNPGIVETKLYRDTSGFFYIPYKIAHTLRLMLSPDQSSDGIINLLINQPSWDDNGKYFDRGHLQTQCSLDQEESIDFLTRIRNTFNL